MNLTLLIRFFLLGLFIIYGPFSLGPDEAQYWTWSKNLSYGYYSKPPGIAWQIFLTTSLFGDTEWGVRSSALILGTLLPFALYFAALKGGYGKKVATWSAVTMALIPAGVIGSILAITDGGMLVFWTVALGLFLEGLNKETPPNPWFLGGAIALGALFKWPIYILMGIMLLFVLVYQKEWLRVLLKATAISLLGLLPSFVWNLSHDFVTFRHVGSTLVGGNEAPGVSKSNFLDFVSAQAALLSPLIFFFFWWAVYRILKKERQITKENYFLFLLSMTLLVPIVMSLFEKMQGNWAIFVLPSIVLLTVDDLLSRNWKGWIIASLALSIILTIGILTLPIIQERGIGAIEIPFKMNPFKNTLGWRNLNAALEGVHYDPRKEALVAESYQMASLLSFYSPGQDLSYFVNLSGRRHNQFEFWKPLETDQRDSALFVASEEQYRNNGDKEKLNFESKLKTRFSEVEFLGRAPLFEAYGKVQRVALIFRVKGYQPKENDVRLF